MRRKVRPLCFAHIQKSGGTSAFDFIIKSFRANETWNDSMYQRIWARDFVPMHLDAIRARKYRLVYGHFDPTPLFGRFKGSYFTVLRDPIDRVLSLYNFCATMDDETLGGITGVQSPDFTEGTPSTYALAGDMIAMIDMVRAGLSFADFIRLPEHLFPGLESWSDYLAYLPKDGTPEDYAARFAVIGIADDMTWSLTALAKHMRWPPPVEVPYINKTPRAIVSRAEITADDIAIINSRTRFEAELYKIAERRRNAKGVLAGFFKTLSNAVHRAAHR